MTLPDLTALTLQQVFGLLVLTTLLDVAGAMLLAIIRGTFSAGAVAIWLQSHTLKRVFPIFALAVLGHGVPQVNVPPIEAAYAMALAGLAAYVVETIASIRDSFGGDNTPPTNTDPAA